MAQCTKVLHPTKESADDHARRLKERGYPKATSYQCPHCPFWHVCKGEKRLRAQRARGIPDMTSPRRKAKHRRVLEAQAGWEEE